MLDTHRIAAQAASAPVLLELQGHPPAAAGDVVRLLVMGFTDAERRLLQGSVMLSRRRAPQLELVTEAEAERADVFMVDARDRLASRWAEGRPWLADRPVIWVDGREGAAPGHVQMARPVQWPILPMLLFRAMEQHPTVAGKPAPKQASPASAQRVRPAEAGRDVLVVDDSMAVRAYLRSLLEPRGIRVAEADGGEAALAATAAGAVDCVLMDVLMPGIDGFEACRRIKGRGGLVPPVVMLTSKSSPFNLVRGKMAGCDAYLTKPVDPAQLFQVLQAFVRLDLDLTQPAPLPA
ncbi:response regulator transcription factor [Ramlibacter tataouinensis]|uniref:Candidate response regulator, atypical CheY n=1 Tax=Ramlibacter tataouinensis (strain ATCC BAA-407 / DSM 14655 / LMG 21543 / TTB310) TaxID=365046 RepID=F5XX76_RAMTT|nr:response regulator [Ramlibacter tataouinensis]AEG93020.1 candidate response regulator, atypical CheY [Ramlibacter tataouinensis TTB310]